MNEIDKLILANKAWVAERLAIEPNYFTNLAGDQRPDFLWIGCSDSRVPAEEVTGTRPGEIFVHRNIANLVHHNDTNIMSVLQYAVDALKVKHVIVCGHYGCGGVRASLTQQNFGLLNKWIRTIKDIYSRNSAELKKCPNLDAVVDTLVEHNVHEQVLNLAKTSIIQTAWAREQRPQVHGWVFDIRSGLIKELVTVDSAECLPEVFRYEVS